MSSNRRRVWVNKLVMGLQSKQAVCCDKPIYFSSVFSAERGNTEEKTQRREPPV